MSRELTLHEAQKIVDDWINQFEEGYLALQLQNKQQSTIDLMIK